jgi:hypothetical protein
MVWFGFGLILSMIYGNALLVCSRVVLVVLLAMLMNPTLSLTTVLFIAQGVVLLGRQHLCVCDMLSSPSPFARDGEKLLGSLWLWLGLDPSLPRLITCISSSFLLPSVNDTCYWTYSSIFSYSTGFEDISSFGEE